MDDMVDIGTHSLHIRCLGRGRPVVVIDTGLGDTLDRWQSMQDRIAQITRVCTYDRAGYGTSEPGPMPRHPRQVAHELKLLLDKARIRSPYVLLGHSLGGINAQVFADRYPDRVAGLILLDPAPLDFITGQAYLDLYRMAEQQTLQWTQAAEAARKATDRDAQAAASRFEAWASEHGMLLGEGGAQAAAIVSFGDLPLVVVGSGKANPAFGEVAEAFQQFWIEQNQALANKSAKGTFLLAEESGHHLYEDVPDLVFDVVRGMVEGTRAR